MSDESVGHRRMSEDEHLFDPGATLVDHLNETFSDLHIDPMVRSFRDLSEAGEDLEELMELMRAVDWKATSLGPLETWSQELATQFHLMMLNPMAQSLALGREAIVIYNKAYADIIRDHHPSFFGTPITTWTSWRVYFPAIQRVMSKAAKVGRAIEEKDFIMYLPKNGSLEEVSLFITVVRLPRPLSGFLSSLQENTVQMVRDRRISNLKEFSESWKSAEDLDDLWLKVLDRLSCQPRRFCFAALYTATLSEEAGFASDSSSSTESDEGAYALHEQTPGYDDMPEDLKLIELASSEPPIVPLMRKAHSTRTPMLVSQQDVPTAWQQLAQSHGFEEPAQNFVILPSSTNKLSKTHALIILGLSTRRTYDDAYKTFLLEVQRLISDVINNLISARESAKKKRDSARRARIAKELMEKELALRREQAEVAETKMYATQRRFQKFLELVPSAILILDSEGQVAFANEDWFKVTGHPIVPLDSITWLEVVPSDVQPYLTAKFQEVIAGKEVNFELRMKRQHVNAAGETCGPVWLMVQALAEFNEDGGVERCITTAMDISHQKYAESMQRTRLAEALEAKRQQEKSVYTPKPYRLRADFVL